jgi:hypothetical protein
MVTDQKGIYTFHTKQDDKKEQKERKHVSNKAKGNRTLLEAAYLPKL